MIRIIYSIKYYSKTLVVLTLSLLCCIPDTTFIHQTAFKTSEIIRVYHCYILVEILKLVNMPCLGQSSSKEFSNSALPSKKKYSLKRSHVTAVTKLSS